jgi:hypothetical protein
MQAHVEMTGKSSLGDAGGQTYLDYPEADSSHRRITMLVAQNSKHQ